jgi:hypothetical protein
MPPRRAHRPNRLPIAPPPLRHRVHSPGGSGARESSLERVRRISREHRAADKPFDPEKRGTWKGSSRDLVVNGMKKKYSKKVGGEQIPGTEQEFYAIESEPGDKHPYILVNPSDYPVLKGLIAFHFGAYGDTCLLVWTKGSDWEGATETAVAWLSEYKPGILTSEAEVAQLVKEARQDDPSLDEEQAFEQATADLTYTESGWLSSAEVNGYEVRKDKPIYEAAVQASKEDAVGDPPSGGLASNAELLDQLVQRTAEGMELKDWESGYANDELREVANEYDHALWLTLNELADEHPPENGGSAADLWAAEAPYLVLMTLGGEGVGIWDGSWDEFYSNTDAAQKFLKKCLTRFSDSTGAGLIDDALLVAAEESCG